VGAGVPKVAGEDVNGKHITSVTSALAILKEGAIVVKSKGDHFLVIPFDNSGLVMSVPETESEARP
jgi:hypothetical protein